MHGTDATQRCYWRPIPSNINPVHSCSEEDRAVAPLIISTPQILIKDLHENEDYHNYCLSSPSVPSSKICLSTHLDQVAFCSSNETSHNALSFNEKKYVSNPMEHQNASFQERYYPMQKNNNVFTPPCPPMSSSHHYLTEVGKNLYQQPKNTIDDHQIIDSFNRGYVDVTSSHHHHNVPSNESLINRTVSLSRCSDGSNHSATEPASENGDPLTSSTRRTRIQCFKTKMCHFFLQKKCSRANDCLFAHSARELRSAPNLSKTKICAKWRKGQCCDNSLLCNYAHGVEDLRPSVNETSELLNFSKDIATTSIPIVGFSPKSCRSMELVESSAPSSSILNLSEEVRSLTSDQTIETSTVNNNVSSLYRSDNFRISERILGEKKIMTDTNDINFLKNGIRWYASLPSTTTSTLLTSGNANGQFSSKQQSSKNQHQNSVSLLQTSSSKQPAPLLMSTMPNNAPYPLVSCISQHPVLDLQSSVAKQKHQIVDCNNNNDSKTTVTLASSSQPSSLLMSGMASAPYQLISCIPQHPVFDLQSSVVTQKHKIVDCNNNNDSTTIPIKTMLTSSSLSSTSSSSSTPSSTIINSSQPNNNENIVKLRTATSLSSSSPSSSPSMIYPNKHGAPMILFVPSPPSGGRASTTTQPRKNHIVLQEDIQHHQNNECHSNGITYNQKPIHFPLVNAQPTKVIYATHNAVRDQQQNDTTSSSNCISQQPLTSTIFQIPDVTPQELIRAMPQHYEE